MGFDFVVDFCLEVFARSRGWYVSRWSLICACVAGESEQAVPNLSALESPGRLLKCRFWGPTSTVSESVGLGSDLKFCIFNAFPGDTEAGGPETF